MFHADAATSSIVDNAVKRKCVERQAKAPIAHEIVAIDKQREKMNRGRRRKIMKISKKYKT